MTETIKKIMEKYNITREEFLCRCAFVAAVNVIYFISMIDTVTLTNIIPGLFIFFVEQPVVISFISFALCKVPKLGKLFNYIGILMGKGGRFIVKLVTAIKTKWSK